MAGLLGGLLGGGLGILGSLFGGTQQSQATNATANLANEEMQAAQQTENQLSGGITGLNTSANSYLSGLPQLSSLYGSELGSAGVGGQAPGAALQYLQNAMSPSALSGQTGINAGGLANSALNYLSAPGSTNLASASPQASSFYANEMQNGLNPQVSQNAQSQLQQQYQTSLNSIDANAAPGQNTNAAQQAAQNSLLSNSTNLAGNLAGQSQQLMGQGAQGLLNSASGLDAQKQQMLTQAFGLGNQYNQQTLQNQQSGAQFGQSALNQAQNFTSTGLQPQESALGALQSLLGTQTQLGEFTTALGAQQAQQQAQNNPFSQIGAILSPGSSGGGGLGSLLSGLFK